MPYWSLVVCVTFNNLKWVVQFTSTLYFPVQCHMSHDLKSYFLAFTFHYHSVPPWVHLLFAPALCRAEGTLFGCHEWHGGHSTPHFFFSSGLCCYHHVFCVIHVYLLDVTCSSIMLNYSCGIHGKEVVHRHSRMFIK